ncbi:MAG: aldo/keto reductase [Streptococcaceae bacterium]|jgi:diketogulonate reductase-like aldo/keto reductase|nr:aldo/keto reductase [Streptococcaceae bacterium]MCH4176118.1 aldo/keto reductase [Streptococcaceae bacterium]
MLEETYTLSNGIKIPKIGFGTWLIKNNDEATKAVKQAIQVGYRHIDTAEAYGNEVGVGKGIRQSGVDRQQIFVTTKLRAEFKTYDVAVNAINESLEKLNLDYIDLMIIHSPKPWAEFTKDEHYFEGNLEAWRALEKAYEEGKVKAIGVSNFEQVDLQNLLEHAKIKPMVDQILSHIGNTPLELIEFAQDNHILVEAYSPFGHGDMFQNQAIKAIADKYQVSIAQLAVRYLLQLNLLPLPKASSIEHMEDNAKTEFVITDEDMLLLKKLDKLVYSDDNQIFPVYQK